VHCQFNSRSFEPYGKLLFNSTIPANALEWLK